MLVDFSCARVILIERGGSLGGTLTEGFMPILPDSDNKGGIVRELYRFLDLHGMPEDYNGTDDAAAKAAYGSMLKEHGISASAVHATP